MEPINWEAVSAIAEALGVIVVVASLIFVGFQIRQNTQATKVAAIQNITSDIRAFNYEIGANGEFADIFYNGLIHPWTLATSELSSRRASTNERNGSGRPPRLHPRLRSRCGAANLGAERRRAQRDPRARRSARCFAPALK